MKKPRYFIKFPQDCKTYKKIIMINKCVKNLEAHHLVKIIKKYLRTNLNDAQILVNDFG